MTEVAMVSGRSEAEVVGLAPIQLVLGGLPRKVPPLVIEENEVWTQLVADRLGHEIGRTLPRLKSWDQIAGFVGSVTAPMLDLLIEYDKQAALGGREWIRGHATDAEVFEAFKAVCLVAFPILREARSWPTLTGLVLTYLQGRLTSSSSPSGASTPRPSTLAGLTSSASSTPSSSGPAGGFARRSTTIDSSRRSRKVSRSR